MDAFSLVAAEEIFSAFPQWRALSRSEDAADGTSFLVVEVEPPTGANVKHGLAIVTANGEITVAFDHYHSHFTQWVGDGEHFGTQAATCAASH